MLNSAPVSGGNWEPEVPTIFPLKKPQLNVEVSNVEQFCLPITELFQKEAWKISSYYLSRYISNPLDSHQSKIREKYFRDFNSICQDVVLAKPCLQKRVNRVEIPIKDIGQFTTDKGLNFIPAPKFVKLPTLDVPNLKQQIAQCYSENPSTLLMDVYAGFAFYCALHHMATYEHLINLQGLDIIVVAGTFGWNKKLLTTCVFGIDNLNSLPRMRPIGMFTHIRNGILLVI